MRLRLRRAEASDHTPDQADDLFAPEFNIATHGFLFLDVLRQTGLNAWSKAQADSLANLERLGLVVDVEDVNNLSIVTTRGGAIIPAASHGLGASDARLYLDVSTAGLLTTTLTTDQTKWVQPMGWIIDANTLWYEARTAYQP